MCLRTNGADALKMFEHLRLELCDLRQILTPEILRRKRVVDVFAVGERRPCGEALELARIVVDLVAVRAAMPDETVLALLRRVVEREERRKRVCEPLRQFARVGEAVLERGQDACAPFRDGGERDGEQRMVHERVLKAFEDRSCECT